MSKALKYTGIILGLVVAAFIVLGVILSHVLSPKLLVNQLDGYLFEKTGQHLSIKGSSGLSFFPWLGFDAQNITITSPKGFDTPLAEIGELQIKVKLLPLLKGNVNIGRVVVKKATFNLVTAASGQTNWGNLVQLGRNKTASHKALPEKSNAKKAAPLALSIAKVNIEDANILSTNQKTKTSHRIEHLYLNTSGINKQNQIVISLKSLMSSSASKTINHIRFNGTLHANPSEKTFSIPDFAFENQPITGKQQGAKIKLTGNLLGDPSNQTITLNKMQLSIANLLLQGDFKASRLTTLPTYAINFTSNKAAISKLTQALTGRASGSGQIELRAKVTTAGKTTSDLIKKATGNGQFRLINLSLGDKMNRYISQGVASAKRGKMQTKPINSSTKSVNLWGPFSIKGGYFYNSQLSTSLKDPKISGSGKVNLLTQRINYTVQVSTVLHLPPNHAIPIQFPIYILGTLSNPKFQPDTGKIAGQIAQYFLKNVLKDTIKDALQGKQKGKGLPIKIPFFGK